MLASAKKLPAKEGGGRLGGGGGEVCARGIYCAEAEQGEVQETQKCQSHQLISVACEATERPPSFFFHEYGRRVGMVPRSSLKEGIAMFNQGPMRAGRWLAKWTRYLPP